MNSKPTPTETLDVKGQSCPMPIVKTKQAIDDLDEGDVLEVVSTDSGSVSDMRGWAEGTDGVALLEQVEEDELYVHYVEKTA
jgi:tRNA 2-thiouridine synthesizing protein A